MLRTTQTSAQHTERTDLVALIPPYVRRWVATGVTLNHRRVDGTVVVASVRDHTTIPLLSEPLRTATARGGTMLKSTGDRLVLMFIGDDHNRRAEATAGDLAFRSYATIGIATGNIELFLLGTGHHELFVAGEAVSRALEYERRAVPGDSSAKRIAPAERRIVEGDWPDDVSPASFVPEAVRRSIPGARRPQTRELVVACIHLANLDELVADIGAECATRHLNDLLARAEHDLLERDVAFIGSDVGMGGPVLLCAAGLMRARPDDDARLLTALQDLDAYPSPIELRIGVDRGPVRFGTIGTNDTKTFVAMGDPMSRASSLMAYARSGDVLMTPNLDVPAAAEITNFGGEVVYRIAPLRRHHRGVSNMLINLGTLAYEHYDLAAARHYYEQALALSRQLQYQADEAQILTHLGRVALALGDPERSMQCCDEALVVLRDLNDDHATADALALLGRARYADGDSASAKRCWLRALEILRLTESAARPSV